MNKEMDIKAIRKKLKLTQKEFARGLGMSVMSIRRWEAEKFSPSALARRAIEEVYGINPK